MHGTVVGRKINSVFLTPWVIVILRCFWMRSNKIYSCGGWCRRCFARFCLLLYSNLLRSKSVSHPTSKPETHATGEAGCHRRLRKRPVNVIRVQLKCDCTGDEPVGKWGGNWRVECVTSTLHTASELGLSSITTADVHISAASSRLNWRPRRFEWTRPFRRKMKPGFCACAITFQTQSTSWMGKNVETSGERARE